MNFYNDYYTTNKCVELILKTLGYENDRKKESHYYRELITLAKDGKIDYKKEGRRYFFRKDEIINYLNYIQGNTNNIEESDEFIDYDDIEDNEEREVDDINNIRDVIVALEKAKYSPEKILNVIKDILNIKSI